MSSLHFDITADNSGAVRSFEQIQESVRRTSAAVQAGGGDVGKLMQALKAVGSAGDLSKVAASAQAMSAAAKEGTQAVNAQTAALKKQEGEMGAVSEAFKRAYEGVSGEKLSAIKASIETQLGVVRELELKYKDVQAAMKGVEDAARRKAMQSQLQSAKAEIDAEKAALQGLQARYKEMSEGSLVSFRTRLMQVTNEMAAMRLAGEQNTAAYKKLEGEMERLGTTYRQVQQLRQQLSTGATQTAALLQGVQGLAGAYSMATGVVSMFTKDQEKLAQVQTKLQSVMAILMGLQQAQVALHSTSAFRLQTLTKLQQWWNNLLDIARGKTVANTAAEVANTAAKNAGAAASTGAAVAQGAQTAAAVAGTAANITLAGALRAVGAAIASIPVIGWVVAGLSALVAVVVQLNKHQEKLNRNIKAYNAEIVAEQQEISKLFDKLRKAEEGTKGWQKARDAIMSKYGSYLSQLDAEVASLRDVEAAYQAVSQAARKAAQERALAKVTEDANAEYVESVGEVRTGLYRQAESALKKQGKGEAQSLALSFVDEFTNAVLDGRNYGEVLKKYGLSEADFTKSTTYTTSAGTPYTITEENRIATEVVPALQQASRTYANATEQARAMFDTVAEEDAEAVKKNLEHWKSEKERNEALYNSLSTDELDSAKAKEYIAAIEEADRQIAKYSLSPKSSSTASAQTKAEGKAEKDFEVLQRENQRAQLALMEEGRAKKLAQIEAEYEERLRVVKEKETEMLKAGALSAEEQAALDEARTLAAQQREKAVKDVYADEAKAMRDYLRQYGSFAQQRQAIEEEYAAKISAASSDGERMALQRQKEIALQGVESNAVSQQIDWYTVFGNVGNIFGKALQPLIDKLLAYTKSPAFAKQDAASQQKIVEAIGNLRKQAGQTGAVGWQDLAADITAYQQAVKEAIEAQNESAALEAKIAPLLEAAKARLASGDTGAQSEIDAYNAQLAESSQRVVEAQNKQRVSGTQLAQTSEALMEPMDEIGTFLKGSGLTQLNSLWGAFNKLRGGVSGLKGLSKSEESKPGENAGEDLGDGMKAVIDEGAAAAGESLANAGGNMSDAINKAAEDESKAGKIINETLGESLSSAGFIAQIVGAVLQILDILKEGIGALVSDLIDTVLNAVAGILDNILTGDFLEQIGSSLLSGVGGILDAVTFGGFSSWFGNGSSDKNLERDLERLANVNEALTEAVDNLADVMSDATTSLSEAQEAYELAMADLAANETNLQESMQRASSAYSNGVLGIGGSHSSGSKIDANMTASDWRAISNAVGKSVTSASDFFSLTSEEMWNAATYASTAYAKLKDLADDGYADAAQFMDEYIALWQEVEDTQEEYWEKLTATNFDSIESSFRSLLADMNSNASDFAAAFEEMMLEAVINSLMADKYASMLESWYEEFAEAMESDGGLSASEKEALKESYMSIYSSANEELQELIDALGIDTDLIEEGGTSAWTSMGQDTADELNGRFTALQIAGEEVSAYTSAMADTLTTISTLQSGAGNTLSEMRNLMVTGNGYLEDVVKYSKLAYNEQTSLLTQIKDSVAKL